MGELGKQPAMTAESGADDFESGRRFVRDDPTEPDEVGTPKVPASARPAPNAKRAHVSVSVADSGPGLDLNSVDHLFDAFYTTKPQGLGMGLSISRSIIEAHGGWLCAKANEPKGALFQFMLPIAND